MGLYVLILVSLAAFTAWGESFWNTDIGVVRAHFKPVISGRGGQRRIAEANSVKLRQAPFCSGFHSLNKWPRPAIEGSGHAESEKGKHSET